jgi:hypothetical protein
LLFLFWLLVSCLSCWRFRNGRQEHVPNPNFYVRLFSTKYLVDWLVGCWVVKIIQWIVVAKEIDFDLVVSRPTNQWWSNRMFWTVYDIPNGSNFAKKKNEHRYRLGHDWSSRSKFADM